MSPSTTRNIEVAPTRDVAYIDSVLTTLLPLINTDQCRDPVPAALFVDKPEFRFLKVSVDGVPAGLVMMVLNEVHTCFLEPLRGKLALKAGKAVLDWIWKNTDLLCITSYSYAHRPEVAWFAKAMGFREDRTYDDGSTFDGLHSLRTDYSCYRPA